MDTDSPARREGGDEARICLGVYIGEEGAGRAGAGSSLGTCGDSGISGHCWKDQEENAMGLCLQSRPCAFPPSWALREAEVFVLDER